MCSVVADSLQHHELSSQPDSSVCGIFQARILEWVACPSPGDLPDSGVEPEFPVFPALPVDSIPLIYQGSPILQDALPW